MLTIISQTYKTTSGEHRRKLSPIKKIKIKAITEQLVEYIADIVADIAGRTVDTVAVSAFSA
jgi:hypothetical protein